VTLTALSGCGGSLNVRNESLYAKLPADLKVCFDRIVPPPVKDQMTSQDMFLLVAALKQSEYEKAACGKRLLAFIKST
jgi:hypothetical protein